MSCQEKNGLLLMRWVVKVTQNRISYKRVGLRYNLDFTNLSQTNNSVEGWHNYFSVMLNSSLHLSI